MADLPTGSDTGLRISLTRTNPSRAPLRVYAVLHLDPVFRAAAAIGAVAALRHQFLPIKQAGRNKSESISPCSKLLRKIPPGRPMQQFSEVRPAHRQGQGAQVITVYREDDEGIKLVRARKAIEARRFGRSCARAASAAAVSSAVSFDEF